MRVRHSKQLILALALLVSQWLVLAHDYSHYSAPLEQNCQFCLSAPGFDGGALPAHVPTLPPVAGTEAPQIVLSLRPAAAAIRNVYIRGPPAHLA